MLNTSKASPRAKARAASARASNSVQLRLDTSPVEKAKTAVLVIGAFADGTLPASSSRIDSKSRGRLKAIVGLGDLGEAAGSTLLLHRLPGVAAARVLLVSLGQPSGYGDKAFSDAVSAAARVLAGGAASDAAVALVDVELPGRSLAGRLELATRLLADGAYRFSRPWTENGGTAPPRRGAGNIALLVSGKVTPELQAAVRRGRAIAEGIAVAKDLGNLPGNICNPAYLADVARALGKEFDLDVEVLERERMRSLGMGAALAVGQASAQPCKFIVMHYKGDAAARPIVLVGKGVTFDTGGISLKPGADMDEMKFDMCGAASVFGAMKTAARLALPISLVGIVPAVENMPGGNASRPGDVVRSMSGQTIEILNTDAEGRLALADALTYAERFKPACVIDIATLTGACVIALGSVTSGLFANDDALADELQACGSSTGDLAWRLPMFDDYQNQLKSNFADMSNIGGRPAGAITGACFLARFAGKYKWAHLDIAGTSSLSGTAKGATGRPVPLLSEFLINRARQAARP